MPLASAHICMPNTLMVVPSTQLIELSLQKGARCKVKWSVEKVCIASLFMPTSQYSEILLHQVSNPLVSHAFAWMYMYMYKFVV